MHCGGTISVDHASGLIHVEHQPSLTAQETIRSKWLFEQMVLSNGVQAENYHADNGIFSAKAFKQILLDMDQHVRFSGVGAHHQNGVAKRAIQTVVYRA